MNAIELPTASEWKCSVPSSIIVSRPIVITRPAAPTVIIMRGVRTDSPLGLGTRSMSPGVSRSNPSAKPKAALTKKWIHSTWAGLNGAPSAMLKSEAPRNVRTKTTRRTSTKRMYLVRLSKILRPCSTA